MSLKIHIANDLPGRHIIHYTLQLIACNKGIEFIYSPQAAGSDLQITNDLSSGLPLCGRFYQNLTSYDLDGLEKLSNRSYFFFDSEGKKDLLASIFFLVNSIQEYGEKEKDQYGRYPYALSLQKRLGLIHQNVVQELIDELMGTHPVLSKLATTKRKSAFFLTHDIDTVYGAKNQNGDYALKKHLYHKIPKLVWNHYVGTPDWINMKRIMDIEAQYGFRSTFYWLVYKDKLNGDYDINEPRIRAQMQEIESRGFENGLHKSLRKISFKQELAELKVKAEGQRYHFLRFNLPDAWKEIEGAGIKLDTSLGFSENYGFRNSYGLPFVPYDLKENRVHHLLEVPMNVMDGNFFYQGKSVADAERELISWLDKNKENALVTLNFHNNFFDDMLYAGYEQLYHILLRYFKEEQFKCMSQKDLLAEYFKPEWYQFPQ